MKATPKTIASAVVATLVMLAFAIPAFNSIVGIFPGVGIFVPMWVLLVIGMVSFFSLVWFITFWLLRNLP